MQIYHDARSTECQNRVDVSSNSLLRFSSRKMELIPGSETSTHSTQTPGKYPEDNTLHQQHGESLKTKISFTYTINGIGPKTVPCGTPEVTLTSLDSCPPTLTLCVRPTRNSLTQTTTLESTPGADSFVSSRSWGTKLGWKEKCNLTGRWFISIGKFRRLEWARYGYYIRMNCEMYEFRTGFVSS
jgi:hypothetical protein